MPLFEYECARCAKRFETLVREETVPACPSCGGTKLEKLLSAFAVSARSDGEGAPIGGCGSCGDPRGPGACGVN